MSMAKITKNGNADSNERWIVNDKGNPERWFVDSEGEIYITLRKLREPRPDCTRIITLKQYAYNTMQEADRAIKAAK